MCTEADAPDARSPNAQVSVLAAMPQLPGPAYAGLIDQLMPEPVGSGSESVAECATPVPELLTVIVKPMSSPALTVGASAVFVTVRFGQLTVIVADASTEFELVAEAVAVFG